MIGVIERQSESLGWSRLLLFSIPTVFQLSTILTATRKTITLRILSGQLTGVIMSTAKKKGRVKTGALKGIDNHRCKHTLEQVKQAKRLLAEQKHSHREIADLTGMTRTAVSEISCGRRWKHIEA